MGLWTTHIACINPLYITSPNDLSLSPSLVLIFIFPWAISNEYRVAENSCILSTRDKTNVPTTSAIAWINKTKCNIKFCLKFLYFHSQTTSNLIYINVQYVSSHNCHIKRIIMSISQNPERHVPTLNKHEFWFTFAEIRRFKKFVLLEIQTSCNATSM